MTFEPPADMVYLALSADLAEALQAWIDMQPEPKPARAEAIRHVLRDWFVSHGLLPFYDDPGEAN